MKEINLVQGISRKLLYTDFLITKKQAEGKKEWNEVISASIIGYASDIKEILKPGKKIGIEYKETKTAALEPFFITDLNLYNVSQMKSGDYLKVVVNRRIDSIIKQNAEEEEEKEKEKEETKAKNTMAFPLLFLTEENHEEQKKLVYNMVKSGVTTPMFPDVEEYIILGGQLFIDKNDAKTVLDVAKGRSLGPVNTKDLNRALFLLECLEEWKEYIFEQMKAHDLIKPVDVKYTLTPIKALEVIINETIIEKFIQSGVRNGHIRFSKNKLTTKRIDDFNDFMTKFAPAMSNRIDSLAKPIHRKGDIPLETEMWFDELLRKPMDEQKEAMEACLKSLNLKNKVNLIGEPGVGKTLMMMSTNWIYNKLKNRTMKLLVFCPDTLIHSTWEKELLETLPDIQVEVITSVSDLIRFDKNGYFEDDQDRVFILSQGKAKSGYTLKPAITWSTSKQAFTCMDCGKTVTRKERNPLAISAVSLEPKYIEVPVPFDYFSSHNSYNKQCKDKNCKAVFWEANSKMATKESHFVYISEAKNSGVGGFFPRDAKPVRAILEKMVYDFNNATSEKVKANLKAKMEQYRILEMTIKGELKNGKKVSPYRVSIAEYIAKKMKRKFTNLIIDEFHEFQGDSARTDACVNLIKSIPVVQTGTGTAMNGYAKSRFKTDYMLFPEKMKAHGYKITDEAKYQVAFGVTEKRYRLAKKDGKEKKTTLQPIDKPGISPVIFPLFMQDTSVFISLSDLKESLPPLHHYQIEVDMDPVLESAKKTFEDNIRKVARHDKKLFRTSIQVGYGFLDMPTIEREIKDPDTKEVLLKTPTVPTHVDNKMHALLNFVEKEVKHDNRCVMIYTYYTGDGINNYLRNNLVDAGYKVTMLSSQTDASILNDGSTKKIKKEDRSEFIKNEVNNGTEILIVNPELVKTGMNLIEFPSIVYYQMGYQVYTNRQADRRAWRIGQTQECKIVYIYYKDSIQHDIASLMATKIVASQAIEGHMDAAGLEAILNERTAEEELAKKFFEGVRGKIRLKHADKEEEPITSAKIITIA